MKLPAGSLKSWGGWWCCGASGWKGWIFYLTGIPLSGGRTFTQAGAHYLVGTNGTWQIARLTRDGEATWTDVTASLGKARSQKWFEHDGLRYTIARQVKR